MKNGLTEELEATNIVHTDPTLLTATAQVALPKTRVSSWDRPTATTNQATTLRRGWQHSQQWVRSALVVGMWELKSFFLRPMAYLLWFAATLLATWNFSWLITLLSRGVLVLRAADDPVAQFLGASLFLVGAITLLTPLVTMNLVADEYRRGSWESLMTAPVSLSAVLAGKLFAGWMVLLVCLSPWSYYWGVLRIWNGQTRWIGGFVPWFESNGMALDGGLWWGGIIGLSLVSLTIAAIGLFCSTVSRTPLSAALGTFLVLLVILVSSLLPRGLAYWQFPTETIRFAEQFACWEQLRQFSLGIVNPVVVLGHLSLTGFLVWLAQYRPHFAMWRRVSVILGVTIGVVGLNCGVARTLSASWDLTRQQSHTLSSRTTKTLGQLSAPVQIVMLASAEVRTAGDVAFQQAREMLRDLLRSYQAVQPKLEVRELDPQESAEARQWQQRYPDIVAPCVVLLQETPGGTRHEVLRARDLFDAHDKSRWNATNESNEQAVLGRDDAQIVIDFHGEQAITAALGRLSAGRKQATGYVLQGHGELALDNADPQSLRSLHALTRQLADLDIELRPLDLQKVERVPTDANLLLVAGPSSPLEASETQALRQYFSDGGKALLMFDRTYDSQSRTIIETGWEAILSGWGVRLGEEWVVTKGFTGQVDAASPAFPVTGDHPLVKSLPTAPVVFHECRVLHPLQGDSRHLKIRTLPLLVSHPAPQAWGEGDGDLEHTPRFGGSKDIAGPVCMALAVERNSGSGSRPALVVVGDAEFVSNRRLTGVSGRSGLAFVLSSLQWLQGRKELLSDIPVRQAASYRLAGLPEHHRGLVWKSALLLCALIATCGITLKITRHGWGT